DIHPRGLDAGAIIAAQGRLVPAKGETPWLPPVAAHEALAGALRTIEERLVEGHLPPAGVGGGVEEAGPAHGEPAIGRLGDWAMGPSFQPPNRPTVTPPNRLGSVLRHRRTGAHQVAVAVGTVDPPHRRPGLVLPQPRHGEGGSLP